MARIGMKEVAAQGIAGITPAGGFGGVPGFGEPQGFDATLQRIHAIVQELKGIVEYSYKLKQEGVQLFGAPKGGGFGGGPGAYMSAFGDSPPTQKGGNMADQMKQILGACLKALDKLQKDGYGDASIGQVVTSLPYTVNQVKTLLEMYSGRSK